MRWTIALLSAAMACAQGANPGRQTIAQSDAGSAAVLPGNTQAPDSGVAAASSGDAGVAQDPIDAGPPPDPPPPPAHDGGLATSPLTPPDQFQQGAGWTTTGASGCDGLVPADVPPQLSWTADAELCGDPQFDGEGTAAFPFFQNTSAGSYVQGLFRADGSAGVGVSDFVEEQLEWHPHERGFYVTVSIPRTGLIWVRSIAQDGSDLGVAEQAVPSLDYQWLFADGRGGFVEAAIPITWDWAGAHTFTLELRWTDDSLTPRTDWIPVTQWTYDYNIGLTVPVDVAGNALPLIFFDPPMSMPCFGDYTGTAWVSPAGQVLSFAGPNPVRQDSLCDQPQFAGFGTPLATNEGGIALYMQAEGGWYTQLPAMSGTATTPPQWVQQYGPSLHRLADGAYLAVTHDSSSCARTAEIIGSSGQVCATLPLDRSDGCDAAELSFADGSLALHARDSCTLRWWPRLGSARHE